WRCAVSAALAPPGAPQTLLVSPGPGSSSRAPVPLARRLCLARSRQGVYVRPGYPVKPSTDTRSAVSPGPGVRFSGTGRATALPAHPAPGHGTRWRLRAHLDSFPRTQECDRGAPQCVRTRLRHGDGAGGGGHRPHAGGHGAAPAHPVPGPLHLAELGWPRGRGVDQPRLCRRLGAAEARAGLLPGSDAGRGGHPGAHPCAGGHGPGTHGQARGR
ncbi:hypothetical protein Nmel_018185, partial [Mimus melanotis]